MFGSSRYCHVHPLFCSLQDKDAYSGPHALSILEKLFVSQACAYRLEHYWTYELCHGRFLRQFHEERDGKKIKVSMSLPNQYF